MIKFFQQKYVQKQPRGSAAKVKHIHRIPTVSAVNEQWDEFLKQKLLENKLLKS